MHIVRFRTRALFLVAALPVALILVQGDGLKAQQPSGLYVVRNLVSDGFVPAAHTDPDLVNPWGIVFNPNGFVWVADNETGVSTLYDGQGVNQSLVVTVPTAPGANPPSSPTGIVFSSASGLRGSFGRARGSEPVHLRDGGWNDLRLGAERRRHARDSCRRQIGIRRHLQGPGAGGEWNRAFPVRHRLPPQPDRRVRRQLSCR